MLYYVKTRVYTFYILIKIKIKIVKEIASTSSYAICYTTIYDMTMLALVSYMTEWKYLVYPDSILKHALETCDLLA
jgi:hypothetical protein